MSTIDFSKMDNDFYKKILSGLEDVKRIKSHVALYRIDIEYQEEDEVWLKEIEEELNENEKYLTRFLI
jgi:ribosomal protein L18E